MAIRNISQVYCSLNLGLIYSVSYSYTPQDGSRITLFFVNKMGKYTPPTKFQRTQIKIGNATFSMIAVASQEQYSQNRRVMQVEFVDDTYLLNQYLIVLTGRGCGEKVYQLGTPVDNRTLEEKVADSLDPTAQQIADFTVFPDLEYNFDEFIAILRQKFTVQIQAFYNSTVTNPFTGTFRDVLDQWCAFFNISWFIENGIIKIFDPTQLIINLPAQPQDAIEYTSSIDWRDTYGKTCFNWFQQPGGEYPLNQTSSTNGDLLVRTDTLYPIGYEFNLDQNIPDINQVTAAQFGKEFWFLYNYYKGTTNICGWTPLSSGTQSIFNSIAVLGGKIASVNENVFDGNFQAYQQYGANIAGRWYMSNRKSELSVDQQYQWFDESDGQIFSFQDVDEKAMSLTYLTPTTNDINIIPNTPINSFYSGINYFGNRIVYQDQTINATTFVLSPVLQGLVSSLYQSIYSLPGSASMDFNNQLSTNQGINSYVAYVPLTIPQDLTTIFDNISSYSTGFEYKFESIPIKGISSTDYASLKATQSEQSGIGIVNSNDGPSIVSNTAVIKTVKDGAYTVYYDKYEQCGSASSNGDYFEHRFEPRQISTDNQIGLSFTKEAGNIYKLNRDFSIINNLVNNPLLPQLAQARSFPTRRVTFTLNYFDNVPSQFLTNGLVGLDVEVSDNGISASYTYSNEILAVPYPENRFAALEQQIKNSWIRQYTPTTVIT